MQVKWLLKALQIVDEEATHIAQDDASAARLVVQRVMAAVGMLADQLGLGRPGLGVCAAEGVEAKLAKTEDSLVVPTSPG